MMNHKNKIKHYNNHFRKYKNFKILLVIPNRSSPYNIGRIMKTSRSHGVIMVKRSYHIISVCLSVCFFSGLVFNCYILLTLLGEIRNLKILNDKLIYIPNDNKQNYPFCT